MIDVTPFERLGTFENGWLDAHYHFSFAGYRDPERMGLGALRAWNDDVVGPRSGFEPHPHRDMEIVTYVRKGTITHQDSLGNRGKTAAGDVQVMSAGSGIVHAEMNDEDEPTVLFQIWIQTDARGHEPRWDARKFPKAPVTGRLPVLASGRKGDDDALMIHQDAAVLGGRIAKGGSVTHTLAPGRAAYLVVAEGMVLVNGQEVPARAGAAITSESAVTIAAPKGETEVVLVDVPLDY
ncbi:MAG: pirin family protein [Rhodospirillaceae bacterium]